MSKTKKIAVLAIIAMVLTLMPAAMFGATADSTRLSGTNRVGTALDIASASTWGTSVILAAADNANLVDALAAAPLASQENAPILLTFKGSLDAAVKAKIAALGATKVYIVGAISDSVASEVDAMTGVDIVVLKGAGRQATAAAINAKLTSPAGTFVVGFDAVADALSIASYAAKNKYAIMLANADGTFSGTAVGTTKYIVGGTAKVADITGYTRISGANRYATNNAVASTLSFTYDRIYVANGVTCVDALSVAPLAAKYNAFVALASASDVAAAATVNAKLTASSKVIAVGGTSAVSDTVAGKVNYASSALAVESVSAINAKQISVKFTQAVDKTAAELETNYMINNAALVVGTDVATLQADGKSVVITLNTALVNGTTYVLQVKPIASFADAKVLTPVFVKTEVVSDKTAPTISSVKSSTATNYAASVEIKFSEPVASGSLKIDGVYYAVTAGDTTTISGLNLSAASTHTLEYINITDYASVPANITAYGTMTFSVVKDTAAPTATLSSYSEKQILVTFSKPMGASALAAANYAVANESLTSYTFTVAAEPTDLTGTKYVLTITQAGIFSTTVTSHTINLAFKATLLDTLGNAMTPVTVATTVTKDVTAPTVTDIIAEKNAAGETTDILVKFSEGLAANGAGVASNLLTIVDTNGVLVTAPGLAASSAAIVAGDKYVKFNFTAPAVMNVKWNITVPLALVSDQAETANTNAAYTKLVDMSQTATGTFLVTNAAIAGQVITVTYPAAVKGGAVAGSATDPLNYSVNGVVLAAGTSITLDAATRSIATITLVPGTIAASDTAAVFRVANVQDLNGNVATPYLKTLSVTDNTKPVLTAATLNADNSISATFSETVVGLVKADVVVKVNGAAVTLTNATIAAGAGADAGKWVIGLNALILNNAGAAPAIGQTFFDMNGNATYDAGVDILIANETAASFAAASYKISTSAAFATVTFGIVPTGTTPTGADASGNKVTNDTVVTVK